MNSTHHVLIIGFVWPEPDSSAAGSRMLQLIDLFIRQGWKVTFASTALASDYMVDLDKIGVAQERIVLNDSGFDTFVKQLNPSIVLFDRFMTEEQFGWRIAENCPNALRILDTEDLHCLRHARHLAIKEDREFSTSDLFSDIAKREVASILRSDISLMISEVEIDLLRNFFKVDSTLLHYLPFLLKPINRNNIAWSTFEEKKDFVFVGNFHHEPNRDAMLYLKEHIWPQIRKKLPNAIMKVYGAYLPPRIAQLHKPEFGFYIMGRAQSSMEVVENAKVVLAPLRFGAGIKGKLTEAMICGTPSVTTSIGAESMHGELDWNGIIVNSPEDFAIAAVTLYQDAEMWDTSRENGIEIINQRFQASKFETQFIVYIQDVISNLENRRLENFTGAMLLHQTMAATKYMSRWIEVKSRLSE